MRSLLYPSALLVVVAALIAAAPVPTSAAAAQPDEADLIAVLESADAPPAEKAITCKKLAVFGSKKAVPALAPLLHDERLISWARIALEAIPGPEADEALRKAMGSLKGRSLVGVINSIGVRRDAKAVSELVKRLDDEDVQVACSAAVALGKIGGEPALQALRKSLAAPREALRSAAAEGCVHSAERLLADGKAAEAAALYDEVRGAKVPKQRIVEATRGAILARGEKGIPLLVEHLRCDDNKLFQVAVMTAREMQGKAVADAVASEMAKATGERSALLLAVLADRGDAAASPAIVTIAKSGAGQARIAAIGVLKKSGDAACVSTLLEVATDEEANVAESAQSALAEMPGKEVDAQIAARLSDSQGETRVILMRLVGKRRIDATAELLKGIDDADARVRAAALAALGETVKQKDLAVLIDRVAAPKRAEDLPAAEKALKAACVRMPDGEACAAQLATAMKEKSVETQVRFLEVLGAMDNPRSLQALSAAAKSGKEELVDVATRLLGEAITLEAGPVLLDLAKTLPDGKYKIRAIRGYIRLIRQFNMDEEDRVQMCVKALGAAERPEERKLLCTAMELHPSLGMLRLAADQAKKPELKEEAARAVVTIAQKLGGNAAEARKLLAAVGQKPLEVEIVKAEYGAGDKWKDVTSVLKRHVSGLPIIPLKSPQYNQAFGGDPVPGVPKVLKIQYRIGGKAGEVTLPENASVVLPVPE